MVEQALVQLALVAMEIVESREERGEEVVERVQEIWSQLANKLVFFYFLQLINITSLINQLREKVSTLLLPQPTHTWRILCIYMYMYTQCFHSALSASL